MLYNIPFDAEHPRMYRTTGKILHEQSCVVEIGYNLMPRGQKQIMTRNVFVLHYVTAGKGRFMDRPFSAGDCFFVVPGELEIMEADKDEPYECYWIMLSGEPSAQLLAKCGLPEHNSVFKFDEAFSCAETLKKYLFLENDDNEFIEACKLEEAFYKICARHFNRKVKAKKQKNDVAFKIAECIEKNYNNSNFRINDLCGIYFLSKNYLCTVFKRQYGVTPQEYLISYRMEKAKALLRFEGNHLSIGEIALAVGIENPLYFSRCFHMRVGVSPSKYKE